MKSVAIIDGSYNIYRSVFKGMNMQTSTGVPSGGAFIFLKMLWNIKELGNPIVVLDSGHSKFRTDVFPEYKKKEEKKPEDRDEQSEQAFKAAFSTLTKLLPQMGIPVVKVDGEEADDVAFLLAKHLRSQGTERVFMVSDDADWEQNVLLGATVFKAMKDEYVTLDNFESIHGFKAEYFPLWKSIIGDGSDGIPGVKGVGPVGASKIIKELSSPDVLSLYEWANAGKTKNHEKIRDQFSIVRRNMLLIDFNQIKIEMDTVISAYNQSNDLAKVNFDYVKNKFQALEFNSLTNWLVYLGQKS